MKPIHFLLLPLALLLAGCSTIDRRINEKSALFETLDAATQEQLRQGTVKVGDTLDMVYIALGRPDEKREIVSAEGRSEVWIYSAYYSEYVGTTVRYRRYYHPVSGQIFVQPIRDHHYRDRADERIRVSFRDGKVTVIEQVQF